MAKIVIVDVETTGLDPFVHQILEIGAVLFDSETCHEMLVEDMPHITIRIKHDEIFGMPKSLMINQRLIKMLADGEEPIPGETDEFLADPEEAVKILDAFVFSNGFDINKNNAKTTINLGGKNVASFDYQFLRNLPGWDDTFIVAQRMYDPSSQFLAANDRYLPNLMECANRAGLQNVVVDHTALGDARILARILQMWFAWNVD